MMIWSEMVRKECRGCKYWCKAGYCDYAEREGQTRIAKHGGDYRVLEGVVCPDRVAKRSRKPHNVWRGQSAVPTKKKIRRKKA